MLVRTDAARGKEITPRSFLQAAEFEDRGDGSISISGRELLYKDRITSVVVLRKTWTSIREAKLQMDFYRSTFQDVKTRRERFRLIEA